jgi:hypothetical protein
MNRHAYRIISKIGLAAAGLVLCVGVAAPAFASPATPFSGSVNGTIQITGADANGNPTSAAYGGSGLANHLGRMQMQGNITITGPAATCSGGFSASHQDTLTAADGSQLLYTITESSCPRPGAQGTYDCTGVFTVTGGTGRFAATTGSGEWDGTVSFGPNGAGVFSTTYSGVVSRSND